MQEKLAYVKSDINLQCQNDDKPVSIKLKNNPISTNKQF